MMTLLQFLKRYRIPFKQAGEHHHVRGDFVGVDCPFCRALGYHLGLNERARSANCWRCGRHDYGKALRKLTGAPWEEIAKQVPGRPQKPSEGPRRPARVRTPPGVGPLQEAHRRYLEGRGFDPDQIVRLWEVQGIGISAQLPWRLWIPVFLSGTLVSWTTRAIGDTGVRYISARPDQEAVPLRRLVYGADYVRQAVIVCEGPTDVWRIGPGAVCTFGVGWSLEQRDWLAKVPVRVIAFDSEVRTYRRADQLARSLSSTGGCTCIVSLETGDDVASASPEEVAELRQRWLATI